MSLDWLSIRRADTLVTSPWRNRAGRTVELFAGPAAGTADPEWRLSIAIIDADAPYSDFSGYRRQQVLLGGGPLQLLAGAHALARLEAPGSQVAFDGAAQVHAIPENPCRVANTFARRGWQLEAWLRPLLGTMMLPAQASGAWLGQVIGGQLRVRCNGEASPLLHRDDAFRIDDRARPWAVLEGSGLVLLAQVRRTG